MFSAEVNVVARGLKSGPQHTRQKHETAGVEKCPTGIRGLDEITGGGLPRGRPTLLCGSAGCGKTVLGMEFLVRGATQFNESGVYVAFEETGSELIQNVASFGFDVAELCERKKILLDHVRLDRSEIEETGEYSLDGLFIRLDNAIKTVHAKRVVLDTVEALFGGFANEGILRSELSRLFRWLKSTGVTAIVTGESGDRVLTRHGLEEYVADCVILLDHRVADQNSIRRLRVVKYRGSLHGTNEYPFLIGKTGISVLPATSLHLDHKANDERVSSGIPRLDTMLGGKGFFRGTSVLVSGAAGTGKSSMAAHFVCAACQRGERALYFASEQSPSEIMRSMRSIGVDLETYVKRGLLRFHAARPTLVGLEKHLVTVHDAVTEFNPSVVVVDPITNFGAVGSDAEVTSMLTRIVDFLKSRQITGMFTSLTRAGDDPEQSEVGMSSQMDTWLLLRNLECNGERNRGLYVLKSRGMAHSNQIREFVLTDHGVELLDVYVGSAGVLTGSARIAQEAQEEASALVERQDLERKRLELSRKRLQLKEKIGTLQAEFKAEEQQVLRSIGEIEDREHRVGQHRVDMARLRHADATPANGHGIGRKVRAQ